MRTDPRRRWNAFFVMAAMLADPAERLRAAEKLETVLQKQTQELLDALSAGDPVVWERYLDPEFRVVDEAGGVQTGKQLIGDIRPMSAGVSGVLRVTELRVFEHGDFAVSTYVADENQSYHGQSLKCRYRTTDTWKKTPSGWRLAASQVTAIRTDPPSITLPVGLLEEYAGVYRLTPAIEFEIRRTRDGLEGVQSGRDSVKLLAEAPDVLFVPGRPRYRYVIQRGENGKITGFVMRREAWDIVWTRVGTPPAKP
jgi:ketosteroid isomerase-like protein